MHGTSENETPRRLRKSIITGDGGKASNKIVKTSRLAPRTERSRIQAVVAIEKKKPIEESFLNRLLRRMANRAAADLSAA
jgi:hypothetical protein